MGPSSSSSAGCGRLKPCIVDLVSFKPNELISLTLIDLSRQWRLNNVLFYVQRNMEVEDIVEEQRKDLQMRLEEAMKNGKVMEIKARSYQDQGMAAPLASDTADLFQYLW